MMLSLAAALAACGGSGVAAGGGGTPPAPAILSPAALLGDATAYTPVNSDDGVQSYYDLGICGPLRDNGTMNLSGICGQFNVPSLRNIALTAPYFALNPQEINDLIIFLCTLTDGYDPDNPNALVLPAQCQAAAT